MTSLSSVLVKLRRASIGGSTRSRRYWSQTLLAYGYLLPAGAVLFIFQFFPVGYAFYISLHEWKIKKGAFIGLSHYSKVLGDPHFWGSFKVTIFYVLGTVPFTIVISLILAYLLFQNIRGRGFYRTVYFLPYITSSAAAAAVWAALIFNGNPQRGIANQVLDLLGIGSQRWLTEPTGIFALVLGYFGIGVPGWAEGPSLALVTIMTYVIWHYVGFDTVIFLAGLVNIPGELYDAAKIDGAGRWGLFRHITLPLLSPTTFFIVLIATIGSFQAFTNIFVMNRAAAVDTGGPLGTTATATVYLYRWFIGEYGSPNMGYAAAIAFVLFGVILLLTFLQFRIGERRVHYGE